MSLQSQLDQEAIDMLPKIKSEIAKAAFEEANAMRLKTLQYCMNSSKAIIDMNSKELEEFQDDLLEIFKYREWIK